jgi:ParB family chromosome partitioning protein
MLIQIDQIKVRKRIRKDLGDLETLKDSMKRYGLLNPITLDTNKQLIAGHRRLESAKQLGWTSISAVLIDMPDEVSRMEMEIEENTQRHDFSSEELLNGYKRLEHLKHPGIFRIILNAIKRFLALIFRR